MSRLIVLPAVVVLALSASSTVAGSDDLKAPGDPTIYAKLSNPIVFTADMDGTVQFYSRYFDYQEIGNRSEITSGKSREVIGAPAGARALHATLVPAQHVEQFKAGDYSMVGLSVVAIDPAPHQKLPRPTGAPAVVGEIGFAYRVGGIERIVERMKEDKVVFVSPLTRSGSGRSLHAAVLDPNGVRVEFYELLPEP